MNLLVDKFTRPANVLVSDQLILDGLVFVVTPIETLVIHRWHLPPPVQTTDNAHPAHSCAAGMGGEAATVFFTAKHDGDASDGSKTRERAASSAPACRKSAEKVTKKKRQGEYTDVSAPHKLGFFSLKGRSTQDVPYFVTFSANLWHLAGKSNQLGPRPAPSVWQRPRNEVRGRR